MSILVKRGAIARVPHTEQRNNDGTLRLEEIHGSYGFSGAWSRKMHTRHYPTEVTLAPVLADFHFHASPSVMNDIAQPFLIRTAQIPHAQDSLRSRTALLLGNQTRVSCLKSMESFVDNEFFRNAEYHELFFIQQGKGVLSSEFGKLTIKAYDYVLVPKGTTYRIDLDSDSLYALIIESLYPIEWPDHYRNESGQMHMTSPVVETEIETPQLPDATDQRGEFSIYVQYKKGLVTKTVQSHHPFDVVGWEGTLYPFTFPITAHHGIAREIHTAPPAHQTFQSGKVPHSGFSLCSFVSQMEGWHPKEVPVPYAHLNVDSDEVMFFSSASYGARESILEEGMITFHPAAIPHSPHGDAAEKSLSKRGTLTSRRAVMFDTYFDPLLLLSTAEPFIDLEYSTSWARSSHFSHNLPDS